MATVFLSYRRDDTGPWAGRLYSDLARALTRSQLFMDIHAHIPRGASFAAALDDALASCGALLALVGPKWASVERDGQPRIQCDDDWVRREIATSLRRKIVVMPVLFDGAEVPESERLPEDIVALAKTQQIASVREQSWDEDVRGIIEDLARQLPDLDVEHTHFELAAEGFERLAALTRSSPLVASAVARYRGALEAAALLFEKVELYKGLHDAFHTVEFLCYQSLLTNPEKLQLTVARRSFESVRRDVERRLDERGTLMPPGLEQEIRIELEEAGTAMNGALQADLPPRGAAAAPKTWLQPVLEGLQQLLGQYPSTLDQLLTEATHALQQDRRLDALLRDVERTARSDAPVHQPQLEPMFADLQSLPPLRVELEGRVEEHSRMQRLDSALRMVSHSRNNIPAKWRRVARAQATLEPFSAAVRDAWGDIQSSADRVDSAIEAGDDEAIRKAIAAHSLIVAIVFKDVDRDLKEALTTLSKIVDPLRMLAEVR